MFEQRFHDTHDHGGDSMWRPQKNQFEICFAFEFPHISAPDKTLDNEVIKI